MTSRRSVVLDDPPDHEVIARVRAGDTAAYDVIYRRHRDAVHRLARRFARHASEADDVTSEVFAKTLRAIVHGHGPTDDAGPYLLRSVRNTVTTLRVGSDARAIPTDDDQLDRPNPPTTSRCDDDDVSLAFLDLPDRYRDVLWATVVEGHGPADIADGSTDAGAVASLTHRARFALRRSYLISSTRRRCAIDTCREIRQLMPSAVLGQAAASTCGRIDDHALACSECAEVRDDMAQLARHMPARSLLGLLGAWWTRLGSSAAQLVGSAAPIVAPAIAATIGITVTVVAATSTAVDDRAPAVATATEFTDELRPTGTNLDAPVTAVDPGAAPASPAPTSGAADTPTVEPDAGVSARPDPTGVPTGAKSVRTSVPGDASVGIAGAEPATIPTIVGAGAGDPTGPLPGDPLDGLPGVTGTLDGVDGVVDDLLGSGGGVGGVVGGVGGVVNGVGGVVGGVGGTVNGVVDAVVEPVIAGSQQVVGAATGAVDEMLGGAVGATVEAVDVVVDRVDSTLGQITGAGTSTPPTTLPIEPLVDEVVTTTKVVTGLTDDTLDAVTGPLTGIFGR